MNSDDHRDQLIDMLLRELVGNETPPDVRVRVLEAADREPRAATVVRRPVPNPAVLSSARSSKLPALAIAAVVALSAVAWAVLHVQRIAEARTPMLTATSGTVNRTAGPVRPGERLVTSARSSAKLTYPDGTVVELAPDTDVLATARSMWDASKRLELVAGSVQAEVAPQPKDRPMVLSSKDASAVVVGTRLTFHRDGQRSRLEVTEGAVRFMDVKGRKSVLVETGFFAEAGEPGFRHGRIVVPPVRGITGFMLMNAMTDQPIRDKPLIDGETVSLSSLPTRKINIRADYEGEAPAFVRLKVTRRDGKDTGLPPHASNDQKHPPFFAGGDFWPEGRPNDCREWTPEPGFYQIVGEAIYDADEGKPGKPLKIGFQITE